MASLGGPNIITNGLVLQLDAANVKSYVSGSAMWSDLSGNNNNGTLISGSTFDNNNSGNLTFNGSNQYVNVGSSSALQPSSITFCAWVKRTMAWGSGACLFWAKAPSDYTSNGFYIEFYSPSGGNRGTNIITNGTANNYFTNPVDSNTSFPLNTWVFFCFTLNVNTPAMYFNGTAVSLTIAGTPTITSTANTKYILWNSYTYYTGASIGNMQIYNRALSATEVAQNYNATKARFNL